MASSADTVLQQDLMQIDQQIADTGWQIADEGGVALVDQSPKTENAIRESRAITRSLGFIGNAIGRLGSLPNAALDAPGSFAGRIAIELGYAPGELAGLQRIADFYRAASSCSVADAQAAALDPQSDVRRLYAYGGRFLESPANFKAGLTLLRMFRRWYRTFADNVADRRTNRLDSLNAASEVAKPAAARAFERVLFEEIAVNPAIPLNTSDPNAAFGMAVNPAMRFAGRNFMTSVTTTYLQIPPERRGLVYAVFDVYNPLRAVGAPKPYDLSTQASAILLTRILKNYDAVEALRRAGTLDREHLTQLLFGDLDLPANADNRTIGDAITNRINDAVTQHFGGVVAGADKLLALGFMLLSSGDTVDECVAALVEGRTLPNAPYHVDMSPRFESFDGTAEGGRKALLADLNRATIPTGIPNGEEILQGDPHFTVRIGNEVLISRNGLSTDPEVSAASNRIADRVAAFVGADVHPAQLYAVYYAMTQSATSRLQGAFRDRGIATDEHMPVVFTLSKDAKTGVVTIRYSEPEGFPVKFHWEGRSASTARPPPRRSWPGRPRRNDPRRPPGPAFPRDSKWGSAAARPPTPPFGISAITGGSLRGRARLCYH